MTDVIYFSAVSQAKYSSHGSNLKSVTGQSFCLPLGVSQTPSLGRSLQTWWGKEDVSPKWQPELLSHVGSCNGQL